MGEMKLNVSLDMNRNFYEPDQPLDIEIDKSNFNKKSIEENIVRSLKNIFRTPSKDGKIESALTLKPDDETAHDIFSILRIRGYNTTKEQFKLLRDYDYKLLTKENQWKYCVMLSYVCNKKEEYSLSIDYLNIALKIIDDTEIEIQILLEKAIVFSTIQDPETIKICKLMVQLISENSLHKYSKSVYIIWGEYYWKIGKYEESLFQFDRVKDLIDKQELKDYIHFLAFLSSKYEVIDPRESVKCLLEIITEFERKTDLLSIEKKADTYNQIAIISIRNNINNINEDIGFLLKAFDIYDELPGEAIRASYVAGLLEISYKSIDEISLSEKYGKIRERYINEYGTSIEKYKNELIKAFEEKDEGKLKLLEKATHQNEKIKKYWYLTYISHLLSAKSFELCIEIGLYILGSLPENIDNYDLSLIYQSIASSYASLNENDKNVYYLKKAVKLQTGNQNIHWRLCNNSFVIKDYITAKEQADFLIKENYKIPGPYSVLSHIDFVNGKIIDAVNILKKAESLFPENIQIKEQIKELIDISDGLLQIEDSKYFKRYKEEVVKTSIESEKQTNHKLSRYDKLSAFCQDIIEKVRKYINMIQKTPPIFIKDFIDNKNSMKEEFFRDEFQRHISYLYDHTNAEIQVKEGKADLSIKEDSKSSEIIIEFKIWGRNDYKDCANQLKKYFTDENDFGIVFMINTNKSSIVSKYREEIIYNNSSYIVGTYRDKVFTEQKNLNCLYSEHTTLTSKKIKVVHFIYDFYL